MATGDVWRMSLIYSHSGAEIAVMTMHIEMLSGGGTFEGAAALLKTNLTDLLRTYQASTLRLDEIRGLTQNVAPPLAGLYVTGLPTVGAVGSDEMPHQVAIVVTHKTAYAGRSYRGRHYIPGTCEANYTAGLFSNTQVDAFQTYYDDLIANIGVGGSSADYRWVVWSDKLQAAYGVTEAIVRSNPGTIRRRRVGVGA